MYIILVEHEEDGKKYIFDCTELKNTLRRGDTVICKTIRGEQRGRAVTSPIKVDSDNYSQKKFLELYGAYFPLKRIIGVVRVKELTKEEKEKIAWKWWQEKFEEFVRRV